MTFKKPVWAQFSNPIPNPNPNLLMSARDDYVVVRLMLLLDFGYTIELGGVQGTTGRANLQLQFLWLSFD